MDIDEKILDEFLHEMGNVLAIVCAKTECNKPIAKRHAHRLSEAFTEFSRHINAEKDKCSKSQS